MPQSPPQTLLQRPFCHCEATIGADMVVTAMAGADTIGAGVIGAGTIGAATVGADVVVAGVIVAGVVGADEFGADMFGKSGGSACAVRCWR